MTALRMTTEDGRKVTLRPVTPSEWEKTHLTPEMQEAERNERPDCAGYVDTLLWAYETDDYSWVYLVKSRDVPTPQLVVKLEISDGWGEG